MISRNKSDTKEMLVAEENKGAFARIPCTYFVLLRKKARRFIEKERQSYHKNSVPTHVLMPRGHHHEPVCRANDNQACL